MKIPPEAREYFRQLGARGGQSRSPAKVRAGRRNVKRALAAALAKRAAAAAAKAPAP